MNCLFSVVVALGLIQTPEEPKWAGMEIIGAHSVERATIESAIPLEIGSPWTDTRSQWQEWAAKLQERFDFHRVIITRVRYVDGRVFLVVDVIEKGDESRIAFRENPTGSVEMPNDVLAAYAKLRERLDELFNQGTPPAEFGEKGYLTYADEPAMEFVEQLAELTPPHRETLIRVLTEDADASKRATAATLLNWAGNVTESIVAVHKLLDDPNSGVRNNISRFLVHYTSQLEDQRARRSVIDAMGWQLRRPGHGDRNKSIIALAELLKKFPQEREYIISNFGDDIRAIAEQSILSNVGDVAKNVLQQETADGQDNSPR